jgi:hypothetical protein
VSVGQTVTVAARPFAVAGIYRSGISLEDAGVVLPLAVTQQLSHRPAEISMIAVLVAPGYRDVQVERDVEGAVRRTVALGDPGEVSRVDTNSRVISKAGIIIALLALLLGAVVVINTMAMAVIERRQQFGLLVVVGWSRGRIAGLILGEAIAVSLAGAAVGLGLGVLASQPVVEPEAPAEGGQRRGTLGAAPGPGKRSHDPPRSARAIPGSWVSESSQASRMAVSPAARAVGVSERNGSMTGTPGANRPEKRVVRDTAIAPVPGSTQLR